MVLCAIATTGWYASLHTKCTIEKMENVIATLNEWREKKESVIFFSYFLYPHHFTHSYTHRHFTLSSNTLIQVCCYALTKTRLKRRELMKLSKSHLKCTLLRTFAHHLHWLLWYQWVYMCLLNSYAQAIQYPIHVLKCALSLYLCCRYCSSRWLWNFHNKCRNECECVYSSYQFLMEKPQKGHRFSEWGE